MDSCVPHLGGALRVCPVAEHGGVPPGDELPLHPRLHDPPRAVHHGHLLVVGGEAHGAGAHLQGVGDEALEGDGAGLRHPVAHHEVPHVQLRHDVLAQLLRTRGAWTGEMYKYFSSR